MNVAGTKKIGGSGFAEKKSWGTAAADAPLCCDGQQRIPQLCQRNTQQIQLVLIQPAGQRIGQRRDGCGQFTGVHGSITSYAFYACERKGVSFVGTTLLVYNELQVAVAYR